MRAQSRQQVAPRADSYKRSRDTAALVGSVHLHATSRRGRKAAHNGAPGQPESKRRRRRRATTTTSGAAAIEETSRRAALAQAASRLAPRRRSSAAGTGAQRRRQPVRRAPNLLSPPLLVCGGGGGAANSAAATLRKAAPSWRCNKRVTSRGRRSPEGAGRGGKPAAGAGRLVDFRAATFARRQRETRVGWSLARRLTRPVGKCAQKLCTDSWRRADQEAPSTAASSPSRRRRQSRTSQQQHEEESPAAAARRATQRVSVRQLAAPLCLAPPQANFLIRGSTLLSRAAIGVIIGRLLAPSSSKLRARNLPPLRRWRPLGIFCRRRAALCQVLFFPLSDSGNRSPKANTGDHPAEIAAAAATIAPANQRQLFSFWRNADSRNGWPD